MARGNFPSSKQDQFVLRFPDGMRDRIKESAEASGRSMNAEIVDRLEESFSFAHKEARHRREIAERAEVEDNLHHQILELQRQAEIKDEARIDSLAEIKRLRTDRLHVDHEIKKRQSEIEALRSELGEVREILRNYAGHSEHLHAIEEQLRLLSAQLPAIAKADAPEAKKKDQE